MTTRLLFVFLLAMTVNGCAFKPDAFRGNLVPAGQVVSLPPSGSHAGSWETFDLTIAFSSTRTGDNFDISGSCLLSQHYRGLYSRLWDLNVMLFLVDEQSRVLAAFPLARSMTYDIEDALDFRRTFPVPPGAVGFAFGYDGQVYEQDEGESFYLLPLGK